MPEGCHLGCASRHALRRFAGNVIAHQPFPHLLRAAGRVIGSPTLAKVRPP